ncbi:MAG: hypothetical protein CVV55_04690 [Synergistetes bacterium HGW-Synergistetes-2]|nr:MAG: hypothetical protein CVV55_04690 [Synergistetes bacterium HGW-Synergistetes-2]
MKRSGGDSVSSGLLDIQGTRENGRRTFDFRKKAPMYLSRRKAATGAILAGRGLSEKPLSARERPFFSRVSPLEIVRRLGYTDLGVRCRGRGKAVYLPEVAKKKTTSKTYTQNGEA